MTWVVLRSGLLIVCFVVAVVFVVTPATTHNPINNFVYGQFVEQSVRRFFYFCGDDLVYFISVQVQERWSNIADYTADQVTDFSSPEKVGDDDLQFLQFDEDVELLNAEVLVLVPQLDKHLHGRLIQANIETAVAEDVQLIRCGGIHVVQTVRVQLLEVHLDLGAHRLSVYIAFQYVKRGELGDGHLCYFPHRIDQWVGLREVDPLDLEGLGHGLDQAAGLLYQVVQAVTQDALHVVHHQGGLPGGLQHATGGAGALAKALALPAPLAHEGADAGHP